MITATGPHICPLSGLLWTRQLPAHSPAYLTFARELRSPTDVTNDLKAIVEAENFVPQISPYLKNLANSLSEVREMIEVTQDKRKQVADRLRREPRPYEPGDLVLVTTNTLSSAEKGITAKLSTKRDGPYRIKEKISPTTFEISTIDTTKVVGKYHVSDLAPFKRQE